MSTFIIIQARTGSSRLPNKMLMPFYEGKGILQILLERIKEVFPADFQNLVVATTNKPGDDAIEKLTQRLNVKCYRGDEEDVLSRFVEASEKFGADKVIRICADNVFLDTRSLFDLYKRLDLSDIDYVSYCKSDGTPSIKTHYGFWAEGVSCRALSKVMAETNDKLSHEHVTIYIYTHPEEFSIELKPIEETIPGIEMYESLRLTIDTAEDFSISQDVYNWLKGHQLSITPSNIITFLNGNPEYFNRMQTVINNNLK